MTDILTVGMSSDAERNERAQRAVKTFRAMQPTLSAYARILTRNNRVRVEVSERNPCTDGTVIYFRPPLELGDLTPHVRKLCDKHDESGRPLCDACRIREKVLIAIYHEIAHIAEGTFEKVSERAFAESVDRAIAENHGQYAEKIRERIRRIPESYRNTYMKLSGIISPFLPMIVNSLEDARVNNKLFEARRGTRAMFDTFMHDVFAEGVEQRHPETGEMYMKFWRDYPLNSQIITGIFCKAAGYDYSKWFAEPVVAALDDEKLTKIMGDVTKARYAGETYDLAFPILARIRELGFCKSENDPEPDPEPEPEPEPEQSEEQDEQDANSDESPDGDQGQPSSSGDPSSDDEGSPEESPEGSDTKDSGSNSDRSSDTDSNSDSPDHQDEGTDSPSNEEQAHREGEDDGAGEGSEQDSSDEDASGADDASSGESGEVEQADESNSDRSEAPREVDESGEGDPEDSQESSSGDGGTDAEDGPSSSDVGTGESQGEGVGDEASEQSAGGQNSASQEPQPTSEMAGEDSAQPSNGEGEHRERSGDSSSSDESRTEPSGNREDLDAGDPLGDNSNGPDKNTDPNQLGSEPGSNGSVLDEASSDSNLPEGTDGDDGLGDSTLPSEDSRDSEPIDTGADRGKGGTKVIIPEGMEFGSPEDVQRDLDKAIGHGDPPDVVEARKAEEAIKTAVIQGMYFETPSQNVNSVRINHYGKPSEGGRNENAWETYDDQDANYLRAYGVDGEFDPDESVMGPALLKMRRVFADNRRAKSQKNLKSGRINARVLGKRAPTQDERLFKHRTMPGKKDYSVVIGMDISGSTSGVNIALEKRAVMAQANLLHRMGIDFAIVAHSAMSGHAGATLDIYSVKDFGEPWAESVKERLRKLGPYSGNLDGHALEYMRRMVERTGTTDKVIMYYSDGKMPAMNFEEELEILQREIRTCRMRDIKLLGVGIRTDSPTKHGLDTVEVEEDRDIEKVVKHLEKHLA